MQFITDRGTIEEVLEQRKFTITTIREIFHVLVDSKYFDSKNQAIEFFKTDKNQSTKYWFNLFSNKLSDHATPPQIIELILREFSIVGTADYPWHDDYSPLILEMLIYLDAFERQHTMDSLIPDRIKSIFSSLDLSKDAIESLKEKIHLPLEHLFDLKP
jgi:hypothetical protein